MKYITTAIPYVNGTPHIGHTLDYLLADTYSRFLKLQGETVKFQAGTDEHGNKIFNKAAELGIDPQVFVDQNSAIFQSFIAKMGVEYTDFIRTTDEKHMQLCQAIWEKLSPHIYKSEYKGWYCSGCEGYVTDTEHKDNDGLCPDHKKPYERLHEENYYLRISDFKAEIADAIKSGRMRVLPDFRAKEILNMLENASDVSISRPKASLTWGIPVPNDDSQVMYVWVDALSNYLTILGYPEKEVSDIWPAVAQFVGKDILRFHAIIWPAILLGLGLELPKVIHAHGHILSGGQKMGKSLGNVVDPAEILNKYGLTAFRYFFLRHIDSFMDSDFTWDKFDSAYNSELANDYGNLVQRLATLAHKNGITVSNWQPQIASDWQEVMETMHFSRGFDLLWQKIKQINQEIDTSKPWALAKEQKTAELDQIMTKLITDLLNSSYMLSVFLPEVSQKVIEIFTAAEIAPPTTPLFPKENLQNHD